MTNRYYCFPDIHGCKEALDLALEFVYAKNSKGGKIIFLGDFIDRGPDNLGVLRTVMNPPENWEFICLMGNHEQMFIDTYRNRDRFYEPKATLEIAGIQPGTKYIYDDIHNGIDVKIIEWMEKLKPFHIEDKNVFAHAFYDDTRTPANQNIHDCIWTRMSDHERYWNYNQGLFLTHGHTPRRNGPVKSMNRVNLDAGAVFYGKYVIGEYEKGIQGPVDFNEFRIKNHLDW